MSDRREIKSICLETRGGELQHIHDESDMAYSFGEKFLEITTSVRKFLISFDTIASMNIEYGETAGECKGHPEEPDCDEMTRNAREYLRRNAERIETQ